MSAVALRLRPPPDGLVCFVSILLGTAGYCSVLRDGSRPARLRGGFSVAGLGRLVRSGRVRVGSTGARSVPRLAPSPLRTSTAGLPLWTSTAGLHCGLPRRHVPLRTVPVVASSAPFLCTSSTAPAPEVIWQGQVTAGPIRSGSRRIAISLLSLPACVLPEGKPRVDPSGFPSVATPAGLATTPNCFPTPRLPLRPTSHRWLTGLARLLPSVARSPSGPRGALPPWEGSSRWGTPPGAHPTCDRPCSLNTRVLLNTRSCACRQLLGRDAQDVDGHYTTVITTVSMGCRENRRLSRRVARHGAPRRLHTARPGPSPQPDPPPETLDWWSPATGRGSEPLPIRSSQPIRGRVHVGSRVRPGIRSRPTTDR